MVKVLKLFLALVFTLYSIDASACGMLDHSNPKVGQTLKHQPDKVTVWLTEDIDISKSNIKIVDSKGNNVTNGQAFIDQADLKSMSIQLKPLKPGAYKVNWKMTALGCGHISEGNFPFYIQQ